MALFNGCVLVARDDGEFNIWDIVDDKIVHTSVINEDGMPILNIKMIIYSDHCKVNETVSNCISFLFIYIKSKHYNKKQNLENTILIVDNFFKWKIMSNIIWMPSILCLVIVLNCLHQCPGFAPICVTCTDRRVKNLSSWSRH